MQHFPTPLSLPDAREPRTDKFAAGQKGTWKACVGTTASLLWGLFASGKGVIGQKA